MGGLSQDKDDFADKTFCYFCDDIKEPMNIGMVVDNELDGDVRVLNEARSLCGAGYSVYVLCLSKDGSYRREERDGFHVIRILKTKSWRNKAFFFVNLFPVFHWSWKKSITKFVKDYQIEVVHAHDLYMAKSAIEATEGTKTRCVIDLHENFPEAIKGYRWAMKFPNRIFTRPGRWKSFEKKYLPKAHRIVVLSENFRKQLLDRNEMLSERKTVIYSNVPDVEKLESYPVDKNILPEKRSSKVLFYFGGIARRRGIYTLITAHQKLLEKGYDVKLLLIGPVDKAERSRFLQAIASGVRSQTIVYHEWKEMTELPSYILSSDICFSPIVKNPQHESGIANKVFQYMLFERPVVVSNSKPQQEVVEQGQCGLSFLSEDASDLTEKTAWLLDHPEKAKEMGRNGRQLVKTTYNSKAMAKNLIEMYEKMGGDV